MGLFEERYVSPADDTITSKKKKLLEVGAKKRNDLASAQDFTTGIFEDVLLHDADTYAGQRLGTNQPGYSFDAYETSGKKFADGVNATKSRERQALFAAQELDKPVEEVTDQDIFALGEKSTIKASDLLFEGQENYFVDGTTEGPVRPNISESGMPVIETRQTGTGYYGRPLVEARNPITGKSLLASLNNPQDNTEYYSRYNEAGREAYNKELNAVSEQEKVLRESKAVLTDEQSDTLLGKAANTAIGLAGMFGEGVTQIPQGIAKSMDNLINNAADISEKDQTTFAGRRVKEEKSLDIQAAIARLKKEKDSPDKTLKMAIYRRDLANNKLTVKEQMLDSEVNLRGVFTKTKYEALAASERIQEQVIDPAKEAGEYLLDLKNKENTEAVLNKAREENFSKIDEQIGSGDITGAIGNALAGSWKLISDPETVAGAVADSFGFVAANAATLGMAPYARATTLTDESYDEFNKKHGRNPNDNEQLAMYALNLASSLIDSSVGKYITTPKKQLASEIEQTLKNKVVSNAKDVLKKGGAEYAQESVQQIFEDQASTQDITKIEAGKVAEAGALGFAGGVGSGAVANVKGALTGSADITKKGVRKVVEKGQAKVRSYIEDKQDKVIVDPKTEGYDADAALEVTRKKGTRDVDIDTYQENIVTHGKKALDANQAKIKAVNEKLKDNEADANLLAEKKRYVDKGQEIIKTVRNEMQTVANKKTSDSITKTITEPTKANEADIKATNASIRTSDRFGSEQLDGIISNKDMPASVVESAKLRKELNQAETKLDTLVTKISKSKDKVRKEVLTNTEKSSTGKYSVTGYRNAFKEAIASGNKQLARKLYADMAKFRDNQKAKLESLKKVPIGGTAKYSDQYKNTFVNKELISNGKRTTFANILAEDVKVEVEYLDKYLALMAKKGQQATKKAPAELNIDNIEFGIPEDAVIPGMDEEVVTEAPVGPITEPKQEVDTKPAPVSETTEEQLSPIPKAKPEDIVLPEKSTISKLKENSDNVRINELQVDGKSTIPSRLGKKKGLKEGKTRYIIFAKKSTQKYYLIDVETGKKVIESKQETEIYDFIRKPKPTIQEKAPSVPAKEVEQEKVEPVTDIEANFTEKGKILQKRLDAINSVKECL